MTSKELALYISEALDSKKAEDITIIDIAEKSGFADYFVICSAPNIRLLSALADEASDKLFEAGVQSDKREGQPESGWILLDAGDVIINIFGRDKRDHYNIEKVWNDCSRIEYEREDRE